MSPENVNQLPDADVGTLNFEETRLTLGLPGSSKSGAKRGFSETVDLNLDENRRGVVGWPPVRSSRKNIAMKSSSCKYVKVAVDGAPFLRKVDLEIYNTYHQLFTALDDMFSCFTIRNYLSDQRNNNVEQVNRVEYVPTYEDKDGDWMLVGDVPWQMFVESCKRLRLMTCTEAIGLAPRTPNRNSSRG